MLYSDFHRLRLGSLCCSSFDLFLAEEGGSVDAPDGDLNALIDQLRVIYSIRTVRDLRQHLGLTQHAFSQRFSIPKRTVEDWENDRRTPPDYVFDLLVYAALCN